MQTTKAKHKLIYILILPLSHFLCHILMIYQYSVLLGYDSKTSWTRPLLVSLNMAVGICGAVPDTNTHQKFIQTSRVLFRCYKSRWFNFEVTRMFWSGRTERSHSSIESLQNLLRATCIQTARQKTFYVLGQLTFYHDRKNISENSFIKPVHLCAAIM